MQRAPIHDWPTVALLLLASCASAMPGFASGLSLERLRLQSTDFTPAELQAATDVWRLGCAALGPPRDVPGLIGDGPAVPVTVRRRGDSFSRHGRCGQSVVRRVGGRIVAAEIDVFMREQSGGSCFPLTDEIAHEIGHLMGLDDGPHGDTAVMSPRQPLQRRRPTRGECAAIDHLAGAASRLALEPIAAPAPSPHPPGVDNPAVEPARPGGGGRG